MFGDIPPQNLLSKRRDTSVADSTVVQDQNTLRSVSQLEDPVLVAGEHSVPDNNYKDVFQSLLNLIDNDRPRLGRIIDTLGTPIPLDLDALPVRDAPSPCSPHQASLSNVQRFEEPSTGSESSPDPKSHRARRRRAGKLSQIFGETWVDFSRPHESLPKPARNRSSRRETLDALIGESYRNIQVEMKRGGIRLDEVGRLQDLLRALSGRREILDGWEEL